VRLLGVHASSFEGLKASLDSSIPTTISDAQALAPPTVCAISSVSRPCRWRAALRGEYRERTHENPVGLPGKAVNKNQKSRVANHDDGIALDGGCSVVVVCAREEVSIAGLHQQK